MSGNIAKIADAQGGSGAQTPAAVNEPDPPPSASVAPAPEREDRGRTGRADAERSPVIILNVVLPLATFAIVIAAWMLVQQEWVPAFPTPAAVWHRAVELFTHPFYDNGPNDMGIGWQVLYSLGRVSAGFALAVAVGIPVGLLIGTSRVFRAAWLPLVQILRPVSPLAWLPIGLLLFKSVNPSAIFVVFITCIWPTVLNTAAGVEAIPKDYMNVAAVLQLRPLEVMRRILLPAALPYIVTGMRLSLGIAWMVIVAAEMLTGGVGIGFYIWDEWNNLNVPSIIVCIGLIGAVGIGLEAAMTAVQRRFDYPSN